MKILAIQNRMGIGDTVIFLPFIKALYKKFNSPISLLVKESSKADQYLNNSDYINEIIILDRKNNSNGKHDGILGSLNLIKDLKRPSKPPLLSVLCQICRKIGSEMPDHFKKVIEWSIEISDHNTKWDAHLICAEALNIDKIPLSPIHGTTLFDVLVVHKELFLGFD